MPGSTAEVAHPREDAALGAVHNRHRTRKPTLAQRLTGVWAVFLGLVFWMLLAYPTNVLVNLIIGTKWDRWLRWQGTTVLVVTLIAALWAASRVVNPPEKFD
jgi:membrane protein YdbS with pleckstrin-like domain